MSTSERRPSETIMISLPNEANAYKTQARIKMLRPVLPLSISHYVFHGFMCRQPGRDEHLTPGTLRRQQEPFPRRSREQAKKHITQSKKHITQANKHITQAKKHITCAKN